MNAETYPRNMLAASTLAHQLRAALIQLGDRTQGQLHDLHRDTSADRCFIAAQAVTEVYTTLLRLGAELDRRI